ncbi:MAG: AAA family ATPase [Bacteroidales bacterium]|nr:AAA family ATPase [Bacteroidales bacterium]
MFENTNNVIVKGGCFTEETELKDILKYPVNILYGPNGSGKTTISRCIASLKDRAGLDGYSAHLPNVDSAEISDSVFVFNEDFIEKYVKIEKNGLKAMVILGPDNLDKAQEDALREEIRELKGKKDGLDKSRAAMAKEMNAIKSNLEKILHDGYRTDVMNIRGRKKRTSVEISYFDDCRNLPDATTSLSQLEKDYAATFDKYDQIRGKQEIVWTRPVFSVTPSLIEKANALLNRVLEKDSLSERDLFIYSLAQNPASSHYIEKTQNDILKLEAERCPLCHQAISGDYRADLRHRLSCVLNEQREQFVRDLAAMADQLTDFPVQLPKFQTKNVCAAEMEAINDKTALLNNMLKDLRWSLNAKSDVLYDSVENIDIQKFTDLYKEVDEAYGTIEMALEELNAIARDCEKTERYLCDLSKKIHYLRHRDTFDLYQKKVNANSSLENEWIRVNQNLEKKDNALKGLQSKRANLRLALDKINQCLAYVFCNPQRLYLEYDNLAYVLKSNGQNVSPTKVSTGERNIIALAYFFTSIFERKDLNAEELQPFFIVIDDPITSFDYGNRIGVFTFIKWQLQELFKKSKASKGLLMSHDQRTVNDLFEVQKQIAYVLRNDVKEAEKRIFFDLRKRKLVEDGLKGEYAVELQNIFDYAFAESLDDERINVTIGNQMRRVLEHYAKIMCDTDFVSMAANDYSYHIWGVSKESEKFNEITVTYKNVLSRMVLNRESHSGGNDYDCFEQSFAPDELQRFAKYLLCFMFDTNRSHLHAFLGKKDWDYKNKIRELHKKLFGV